MVNAAAEKAMPFPRSSLVKDGDLIIRSVRAVPESNTPEVRVNLEKASSITGMFILAICSFETSLRTTENKPQPRPPK